MRTKARGESTLLLLDAVEILRAEHVDYAAIGALAASVHGVIRASRDADALLSINPAALTGLERHFKTAGFSTELRRGDLGDPIGAVLKLRDRFDNRVDLLVAIQGFDPKAFSRTIEVPLDEGSLKVVSLEDFVAMKLFAGGPQDLIDAGNALQAALEPPNIGLLRELAGRYGTETSRSMDSLLQERDRNLDGDLGPG
jgi:hypothetical protein